MIDQASLHEKNVLKALEERTPVVETYIQDFKPDLQLSAVPISDRYFLGRVDFGRVIEDNRYEEPGSKKSFFKGSTMFVNGLTKAFKIEYVSQGFVQMLLLDANRFDREHYNFKFVRREFLGDVRTYLFDVAPRPGSGSGRFLGRVWIEDVGGNIVRFSGTYTTSSGHDLYYHFDSWRTNVQPGLWLPTAVYAEEHGPGPVPDQASFFRAQTWIWGYSLKQPVSINDNETVKIDAVKDQSESAQDVSPLQASRMWADQAETNILDRLYQAGLLAGPSDFDKVLETVTNNLVVTNNIVLPEPIHCRVMLTLPLESLTIGNTIVLSKGLVDTLPSEEDLAAVIAFQLAHLVLGHKVNTEFAFPDNLMFQDQATIRRLPLHHSDEENEAAAKKAIELLKNSPYKDKLGNVGLYFEALQARAKALPFLMQPELGDSLFTSSTDDQVWLGALITGAPKLDMGKLDQIPALPLGSRLRINSWKDTVEQLNVKPVPVLSPGDKMPFELTPVFFRLRTYGWEEKLPVSTTGTTPDASGTSSTASSSSATPQQN
ncbi:MAG TPA: hypothetical protein VHX63_05865 [Acidobacteriaceae bacterium]|jgi:hypothetical protein|nr:hypothetical protein [Acidobacteriaceae bacterium]